MKYLVAASITLVFAMALAFAAYGEGAFNILVLVAVPGLLIALFILPVLLSTARDGRRRIGWWAAAVLGGGLLLLAVTAPADALLLFYLAVLFLTLTWPLAAVAACLMAVAAVRSALSSGPTAPRTWARSSWAGLLALVATYGYGLNHLDDGMADVKDRVCRYPSGGATRHGGGQSLLPLRDTSCGPDTVPAFVNPLLAALTVLLAFFATAHLTARLKDRQLPVRSGS